MSDDARLGGGFDEQGGAHVPAGRDASPVRKVVGVRLHRLRVSPHAIRIRR